jgi:hypothetical protein
MAQGNRDSVSRIGRKIALQFKQMLNHQLNLILLSSACTDYGLLYFARGILEHSGRHTVLHLALGQA